MINVISSRKKVLTSSLKVSIPQFLSKPMSDISLKRALFYFFPNCAKLTKLLFKLLLTSIQSRSAWIRHFITNKKGMPFSKFEIIRSLTQSFTTFEMNKVFIFVVRWLFSKCETPRYTCIYLSKCQKPRKFMSGKIFKIRRTQYGFNKFV